MLSTIADIFKALENKDYDLNNESRVQDQIETYLNEFAEKKYPGELFPHRWVVCRETRLDKDSRPDFMLSPKGVVIEVKVQGSAVDILKQCERYCKHDRVHALVLASAKFMGFPEEINGKPAYFIHLSRGLL